MENLRVTIVQSEIIWHDVEKNLRHLESLIKTGNPETDLIPVCPNCHAMLHKNNDGIPIDIEKLKSFFKAALNDSRRYNFDN